MELPNKSKWEAIPLSRIVELREMIVIHCARRHEDRVVIQISDMRHRDRKSTPAFKVLEPGTSKVDINQVNDHLLITRDILKTKKLDRRRSAKPICYGRRESEETNTWSGSGKSRCSEAFCSCSIFLRNGVRPPLLP